MTELGPLLERVRFAVFDFDGVFTDNRVWVNEQGDETLAFSRSDGLGLRRLEEVGVQPLIVSMERNPIVGARAKKLRVDCVQGVEDKLRSSASGRASSASPSRTPHMSAMTSTMPSACARSECRSFPRMPGPRSSRSPAGCSRAQVAAAA